MKKRLLALLLSAALLLCGCSSGSAYTYFDDMQYVRPDLAEIEAAYSDLCTAAAGTDTEAVLNAVYAFYDAYDWFYTCYGLADIHYCADLRDIYWEEEYNYCIEASTTVDALLEEMYYVLAQSPCREELESEEYFGQGYFDSYDGENLWDEAFSTMLAEEAALISQYYTLSETALAYESGSGDYYDACAADMTQLLIDLVKVRQEMAAYWGYGDYVLFANDFYYYRDYTPAQSQQLLEDIRTQLVPLYRQVNDSGIWNLSYMPSSEEDTFQAVRQSAKAMGGIIWDAFRLMENYGLYDMTYSENKYNASFEIYLTSYYEPFVFLNPEGTVYDRLTLAHEFGHFCNDFACYGSYAGIDVSEVYSQGMEYLSLCYGADTEDLTKVKMADSLSVYVEQAAFAYFEQALYALPESELTVAGVTDLYEQTALAYGFDSVGYDPREFVDITHFYTNPMYIISYVVSNDAALQLYQLEQAEPGAGLAWMEKNLSSQESWFLAFLDQTGLESPFAEGRMDRVRQTFAAVFG